MLVSNIGAYSVYVEVGLARREVAQWLGSGSLVVEFGGYTLSRYDAEYSPANGHLREVKRPMLFEASYQRSRPQLRLFGLNAIGEGGWLKTFKVNGYALRKPRRSATPQQELFMYHEALG